METASPRSGAVTTAPVLAKYLVLPGRPEGGWQGEPALAESARRAAGDLRRRGVPIRFLRCIYLPEDDTCFFLYEAPSEAWVRRAGARAGMRFEAVMKTPEGEPSSGHASTYLQPPTVTVHDPEES